MKRFLAALVAAAVTSAVAQPIGFFHSQDAAPPAAPIVARMKALEKATTSCAIQIRYNWPNPAGEITYIGGSSQCRESAVAAINAALVAPAGVASKDLTSPGEPASPPVYRCGVTVGWDPANAASPTVAPVGGDPCDSMTRTVLFYAVPAVECTHLPLDEAPRCTP